MTKLKIFILASLIVSMALMSGCFGDKKTEEPMAPSNLTAAGISYREIRLSWQDNCDNEEGFKIYCSYENAGYQLVGENSANSTIALHSDLEPLADYYYYVEAYNSRGSSRSNTAKGTTLSGVKILSDLVEGPYGNAQIHGQAQNTTNEMMDSITIRAWFYDEAGILLRTGSSGARNIPAQTIWRFEIRPIPCPFEDVARYDIEVTEVKIS